MNTKQRLNQLSEYKAQRDFMLLKKQELVDSVLTPEIKAKLKDIDAEIDPQVAGVDASITKITEDIKNDVVALKTTVKGDHLMAMFVKGRVTWDTKALEGYAIAHPEVLVARREGEPFVTIKSIEK